MEWKAWYQLMGQDQLIQETDALKQAVAESQIRSVMQLGPFKLDALFRPHTVVEGRYFSDKCSIGVDIVSLKEALPIAPESIEAWVLHHVIDSEVDWESIIQEIYITLKPQGKAMFILISPFSLAWITGLFRQKPWISDWFLLVKMRTLLFELGFEVEGYRAVGNSFLIIAEKRVCPLTPIECYGRM